MPNHKVTWFDILILSKVLFRMVSKGKLLFSKFFYFFKGSPFINTILTINIINWGGEGLLNNTTIGDSLEEPFIFDSL